jgi:hypothetical protein
MNKFLTLVLTAFIFQAHAGNDEFADMYIMGFQTEGNSCIQKESAVPELKAGQILKLPIKTYLEKSDIEDKALGECNFSLTVSAQDHYKIVFDLAQANGTTTLPPQTEMETQIHLIANYNPEDKGKHDDSDYERSNALWTSIRSHGIEDHPFIMASGLTFETPCGGDLELKGQVSSSLEFGEAAITELEQIKLHYKVVSCDDDSSSEK